MANHKPRSNLLIFLALGGLGIIIVCCLVLVAVYAFFGLSESQVSFDDSYEPKLTEEFYNDPLNTQEPAPIFETEAPDEPLQEPSKPTRSDFYQHPDGYFRILPISEQYEEGENYVTFYNDTDIIDATVFDLEGDLRPDNLYQLASEVLEIILLQTDWTESYTFTDESFVSINRGYVVFFNTPPTDRNETGGALFLRQEGRDLHCVTWLTADYDFMEDTFYKVVETYTPGAAENAERPEATPPADAIAEFDTGFRPDLHGFNFENYGNDWGITNLTPVEMQRMFGDVVCANTGGGKCELSPPARRWMNQANEAMDGGHCEGMAVLSQLFYYNLLDPGQFGDQKVYNLELDDPLEREIAYWWVTQATYPGGVIKVNESPSAVVEALVEAFSKGANSQEWWVVGIYQRDGGGGHAVTPLAVDDKGDGVYDILVYDNNWPGQVRPITVDTNNETWTYYASTNPDEPEALYEGDISTETLEIVAISPRLKSQECNFCSGRGSTVGGPRSFSTEQYYEIYLNGQADLLIEDDQGNSIGYLDGELVNTIPGAQTDTYRLGMDVWAENYEPVYKLPVGTTFGIAIIGDEDISQVTTATIDIIGPGFFMSIEDIWLEPGEVDAIGVANEEGFFGLVYISDYAETPVILMGVETEEADYAFWVQATELLGEEDTLNVGIDLDTGEFILNSSDNEYPGVYDIHVLRIDEHAISAFGVDGLEIDPFITIYLQFQNWVENGENMVAEVDLDDDGYIDETIELPDTSDEFYWE